MGIGAPIGTSINGAPYSRVASSKSNLLSALRHVAYAGGWKKFEPMWDMAIRLKRVAHLRPVLESVLNGAI